VIVIASNLFLAHKVGLRVKVSKEQKLEILKKGYRHFEQTIDTDTINPVDVLLVKKEVTRKPTKKVVKKTVVKKPKKMCNLWFLSEASGGSVKITPSSPGILLPKDKNFSISVSCDTKEVYLSKLCYKDEPLKVDFTNKNTFNKKVNKQKWLKYAYLRIDYVEGDNKKISVKLTGFKDKIEVLNYNTVSKKIPLGEYNYQIHSDFKQIENGSLRCCQENRIYMIHVSTEIPDSSHIVKHGQDVQLKSDHGLLSLLTTKNSKSLKIKSVLPMSINKENGEFVYKKAVYKGIKLPTILAVASGKYEIYYRNKKINTVAVEVGSHHIYDFDINKIIKTEPVPKDLQGFLHKLKKQ
jgi:hypothetical protein